jgi:hypothetical protein
MRSKMPAERFQLLLRSVLFVIGGAAFLALILATFLHSLLILVVFLIIKL